MSGHIVYKDRATNIIYAFGSISKTRGPDGIGRQYRDLDGEGLTDEQMEKAALTMAEHVRNTGQFIPFRDNHDSSESGIVGDIPLFFPLSERILKSAWESGNYGYFAGYRPAPGEYEKSCEIIDEGGLSIGFRIRR